MKKHLLTLGLMLLSGVVMAQYPTDGLVGYFPFNGNGDDEDPNGITPSYFNASAAENRNGEAGRSLRFVPGNQEYIDYDMSIHTALQLEGDFTIAFWAKVEPGYAAGTFLFSLADAVQLHIAPHPTNATAGRITIVLGGGMSLSTVSSPTIWNHFMVVREGDMRSLYINNSSSSGASGAGDPLIFDSNMRMRLARSQSNTGELDGFLDDLFIYDRALNATERAQILNHGVCNAITQQVTVTGPSSACAGATVDFTLSEPLYADSWDFATANGWTGSLDGNVLTMVAPDEPVNAAPFSHAAFTVWGVNECSESPVASKSMSVVIAPEEFDISGQTAPCTGSSVSYSIPANVTLTTTWQVPESWVQGTTFPNGNGGIFTVADAGDVTFTRSNECFSTSATLFVDVVQGVPVVPTLLEGSQYPCHGETELYVFGNLDPTATLHSFNLSSTAWSFEYLTDSSFTLTPTGFFFGPYNLTGTSFNVCGQSEVFELPLSSNMGPLESYTWFEVIDGTLSAGDYGDELTYQWLLNGEPIPGAIGLTYTPTETGYYNLQTEFTLFNCGTRLAEEVYIDLGVVGVAEATVGTFSLYPNPATSSVTLDGLTTGSTITLMDAVGRMVGSFAATAERMEIPVSGLGKGMYLVQVMDSGNTGTARLLVN